MKQAAKNDGTKRQRFKRRKRRREREKASERERERDATIYAQILRDH